MVVQVILLHGSETWVINAPMLSDLYRVHVIFYRLLTCTQPQKERGWGLNTHTRHMS